MVQFTLDIKPLSSNVLWAGRRFKTPEYKRYERDCLYLIPKSKKVEGDVEVTVEFFLKNDKMTDTENLLKGLLDICTKAGVYEDDRKIVALHAYKEHADTNSVRVTVTEA